MTELLTHASINGLSIVIIGFFLKRLISGNDRKHSASLAKIEKIETDHSDYQRKVEVQLASINAQITMALATTAQIESLKEKVWNINSRVDAAFKILDHKRTSDL